MKRNKKVLPRRSRRRRLGRTKNGAVESEDGLRATNIPIIRTPPVASLVKVSYGVPTGGWRLRWCLKKRYARAVPKCVSALRARDIQASILMASRFVGREDGGGGGCFACGHGCACAHAHVSEYGACVYLYLHIRVCTYMRSMRTCVHKHDYANLTHLRCSLPLPSPSPE